MRVKLSCARAGHRFDKSGRMVGEYSQAVGEIVDLDDAEANELIRRGQASPAVESKK